MAALAEKTESPVETRRIAGQTFHHWRAPSIYSFAEDQSALDAAGPIGIMLRMGEHFYWTREGDYLLLAQIPQPLIARAARGADTDLSAWLRDTQRQDVSESVIAVSAQTRKLPRRLYYIYLELLQEMAELAHTPIDAWSLPTADQLALPASGALGMSVNLGDPVISAELMFENNPFEGLLGTSSWTSVAMVGVLAAIAIPAYQDYTLRARVAGGMLGAAAYQSAVAEFYRDNGRYMRADETEAILPGAQFGEDYWVDVEPDTGVVVVTFSVPELGPDARLFLQPRFEDGGAGFDCSTTLPVKYVPAACRETP